MATKQENFDRLLVQMPYAETQRRAILTAVQRSMYEKEEEKWITRRPEHLMVAIEEFNRIGAYAEGARLALAIEADLDVRSEMGGHIFIGERSVAAVKCAQNNIFGVAAYLAENLAPLAYVTRLYRKQVRFLEEIGQFGLAASLAHLKLGDFDSAIINYQKSGNFEWAAELLRGSGEVEGAAAMNQMGSLLK